MTSDGAGRLMRTERRLEAMLISGALTSDLFMSNLDLILLDLIYLVLIAVLFVISIGMIRFFDRL
jgi:hypothetical protein